MPPVITLTTDFGLADHYVASMKGVLIAGAPDATIVDVTHLIPRHQVLAGSFVLERAIATFPPGTVHVAVVDPGVGSSRRILIVKIRSQTVVCPDNGLITWAWQRHGPAAAYELTWRPAAFSQTFHGRDIMSPAAAMLVNRTPISGIAHPIAEPILLPVAPATGGEGSVIYIDHYGNCTTNLPASSISAGTMVHAAGADLGRLKRTYADVGIGEPLALIGSSDLLEIAVREGSAAARFGLRVGDPVTASL